MKINGYFSCHKTTAIAPYIHMTIDDPKSIIVRMPNWLGDAVMATPVLKDLRERFPEAKLTAMCIKSVGEILKWDPNLDELFIFHRPSGWLHRQAHRDIIAPLRHGDYDLGILLTNSLSSAWWFWRGWVKKRLGYRGNFRTALLTHPVSFPANKETQHLVTTYKMLVEPLGIPVSDTDPKLYLSESEKGEAEQLLAKYGIKKEDTVIGVNPGAAYGSAKCWPKEYFIELTHLLMENPSYKVVYFGDPSGASLVESICYDMPDRVINLAGKTNIRELLALINACTVFLTNDSGPMHIAAALGKPLLALFGSTSTIKTGPYKQGDVIKKDVSCSPCYLRTCPIDFRCMKSIKPAEVYSLLNNILAKKSHMRP